MKELSIEEKAKAYDEALKVLHKYDDAHIMFTQDLKEEMFPELREEYEDEKMVKFIKKQLFNIKKTITDNYKLDIELTEAIDWLEKQDEHKKFRDSIQIGDKVTRNQDGVLVNLSQLKRIAKPAENKSKHNMGISESTKKKLEDNLHKALEKETPKSYNEFLDNQDEQKSTWTKENERMVTRIVESLFAYANKLQYEGFCHNSEILYEQIDWLKSLRPHNSITDEELFQAKKDAYNDALDKIEYYSGEPTFDDGWDAAIWYLKKKNARPQNTWKPSDEQMEVLKSSTYCQNEQMSKILFKLYQDLKKLKE